jgi:hypothetical protein
LSVTPVAPPDPEILNFFPTTEVFLLDGDNLLQLTSFRFADIIGAVLTADATRVIFVTSANPLTPDATGRLLHRNPTGNCQIFSIDRTGGDLRQLTEFRETEQSDIGCYFFPGGRRGCPSSFLDIDSVTGTVVFYSACDPFHTGRFASQIFAMRPDGSGLRQITSARGTFTEDGKDKLELIGPHAYSAPVRSTRAR